MIKGLFVFAVLLSVTPLGAFADPSTLVPTYNSIRDTIFTAKCLTCHGPGNRAADVPLGDYRAMMADGTIVVPHDLNQSALVKAISTPTGAPAGTAPSMPPKKASIPAVTPAELAVIQTWIQNGAPEQ